MFFDWRIAGRDHRDWYGRKHRMPSQMPAQLAAVQFGHMPVSQNRIG
jgi:hypothetical protein